MYADSPYRVEFAYAVAVRGTFRRVGVELMPINIRSIKIWCSNLILSVGFGPRRSSHETSD